MFWNAADVCFGDKKGKCGRRLKWVWERSGNVWGRIWLADCKRYKNDGIFAELICCYINNLQLQSLCNTRFPWCHQNETLQSQKQVNRRSTTYILRLFFIDFPVWNYSRVQIEPHSSISIHLPLFSSLRLKITKGVLVLKDTAHSSSFLEPNFLFASVCSLTSTAVVSIFTDL